VARLPFGSASRSGGRTVGQVELVLHHLIGAARPLHVSSHFVRTHTRFREPVVAGGLVTALLSAGWPGSELCRLLEREHGLEPADEESLEMRYVRSLEPGDTLYAVYSLPEEQPELASGRLAIQVAGELEDGRRVAEGRLFVRWRGPAPGSPTSAGPRPAPR
jgi:acyl dehydratase